MRERKKGVRKILREKVEALSDREKRKGCVFERKRKEGEREIRSEKRSTLHG